MVYREGEIYCEPSSRQHPQTTSDNTSSQAVERLRENQDSLKDKHFKKEQMWEAVTDVKVWLQGLLIFSVIIVNGLGTTFMPVIVKSCKRFPSGFF